MGARAARAWSGRVPGGGIAAVLLAAVLCAACAGAVPDTPTNADAEPVTTVVLVRHAEKADGGRDPSLDERGRVRAVELSRVVGRLRPAAIFATQFRRTQETLQPLSDALGLDVIVAPVDDPLASSRRLAERILAEHAGGVVVVAGHSNTVPRIIEGLGAGPAPEIDERQYDDLFVVTVTAAGARALALRYGAPSQAHPAGVAGRPAR